MSSFSISFTLKQHTPMIQFQSDQKGATLRATELKPKLDRFLLKKNSALKSIETPNGERYLDYKVAISSSKPEEISFSLINEPKKDTKTGQQKRDNKGNLSWEPYPNFFANLGDGTGKSHKKFSKSKGLLHVVFRSFNHEILEAIKEHFCEFLLKHNFGTRQTKGFGSFYIDTSDKEHYRDPKTILNGLSFATPSGEKEMFKYIEWFYKSLRSGINMKDREGNTTYYFKAASYLYAKEKGYVWDKRAIKHKFLSDRSGDEIERHGKVDILTDDHNNARLVRDLLGLSTLQSWGKSELEKESKKRGKDALIARMKSPLLFKPIQTEKGYQVFLIPFAINAKMYNQEFSIKYNGKGPLKLNTPGSEEFRLGPFLDFAKKIVPDQHVDKKYHNDKDKIHFALRSIYSDLKPKKKQ